MRGRPRGRRSLRQAGQGSEKKGLSFCRNLPPATKQPPRRPFLRPTDLRVAQPTIVCPPLPRQSGETTLDRQAFTHVRRSGSSRSLTARSHAIPAVRSGVRCLRSGPLGRIPTVRRSAPHSSTTAPSASILADTSSRERLKGLSNYRDSLAEASTTGDSKGLQRGLVICRNSQE
jgi:hypothetical protein